MEANRRHALHDLAIYGDGEFDLAQGGEQAEKLREQLLRICNRGEFDFRTARFFGSDAKSFDDYCCCSHLQELSGILRFSGVKDTVEPGAKQIKVGTAPWDI
jgi:hypothetical protein